MTGTVGRARLWITRLAVREPQPILGVRSVLTADVALGDEVAIALAIVPDPDSALPRARNGEMGLEQALALAQSLQAIAAQRHTGPRTPILAVVDTPGQAFGRFEEQQFLSGACGLAIQAYADARRAGHPVLTLVVGSAFSGSFLSHGIQSDWIAALGDSGVSMHAMTAQSIARITRRTLEQVRSTAASVLPMSYEIASAHRLGIIDEIIEDVSAERPAGRDVEGVRRVLAARLNALRASVALRGGLDENPFRAASAAIDRTMQAQWTAADSLLQEGK